MATPDRLGDFEIVEEIGRGGFGIVYRARQVSLDRPVAIKVLFRHLIHTEDQLSRFQREAHAAARPDPPSSVSAASPYFMPPEQADSRGGAVDHPPDISSLGVPLYELLPLAPPFQGQSAHEIIRRILTEDPKRPVKIEPRVPQDLETICLKAM